ncbi:MAG: hypothetical protein IKX36_11270 [Prevotella sp.]|nr:hypothetical protein [Prevotella sp.]
MKTQNKKHAYRSGIICLVVIMAIFGGISIKMGISNMLNTIMHTAHDLLLNTVFFLMGVCVISGAISKLFVNFGVVDLLERVLRPLMKPLFNLPGVASLGAVMTFLSDNPVIITLSKDKQFSQYFKKYQYISLTNFGTAFGMGLIVIFYMMGQGYLAEPLIGLLGAICGCIVSTRLMQRFVLKAYPQYKEEDAAVITEEDIEKAEQEKRDDKTIFVRALNSMLDGGRMGVDVGLTIIPGVLVISTIVMVLTFGPNAESGLYTGAAYEGVELLPALAAQADGFFNMVFGLNDPHQLAFPITALGAVGAALGLVPNFAAQGWIDGNAIAVFTAIGMCWSGYLSTHTAMLDTLGFRSLTSKAILAHTIGGLCAALTAHWFYLIYAWII